MEVKNNLLKVLLTFIFYFINFALIFPQDSLQCGFLKLKIDFQEIQVLINGKLMESTDSTIIKLQPGVYEIVLLNPNRTLWGNLDLKKDITLSANDTVTIVPIFPSLLTVRSQPAGALIYSDTTCLGTTPWEMAIIDSAIREIVIKKEGFLDFSLPLEKIKQNYADVFLMRDSKFNINLSKQNSSLKSRYRLSSYGFFGLSLLSGYASVYLKSQADTYYQKYLNAGSLDRMNSYFQKSKNFDKYSNAALAVLQINFLLFFYSLMK